jgi:hypothetical protein
MAERHPINQPPVDLHRSLCDSLMLLSITIIFAAALLITGLEVGTPVKPLPAYPDPKVGDRCETTTEVLVAPSLFGYKEAMEIASSGDLQASRRLIEQRRAMYLPAATTVFIMERADYVYVRVRPESAIDSVWMSIVRLVCPKSQGTNRR